MNEDLMNQVGVILEKNGGAGNIVAGFDMWSIFASIVFGIIGIIYFRRGKNEAEFTRIFTGIALMIFPYFVSGLIYIILAGVLLCFVPSILKKI